MLSDETNNDTVNEPNLEYNRKIHIFNSFEEQEMHRLKEIANENPIERVKKTVKLILRVYEMNPSKKNLESDKIIYIDKS